jgi:hypothetical protein
LRHDRPALEQVLGGAADGVVQANIFGHRGTPGPGLERLKLRKFAFIHLGQLTLPDLIRGHLILFCRPVFAHEEGDFIAGEFAAEFGLADLDRSIALLGPFREAFEQIRRYPG